jgi:hypothetical protein
LPVEFGVNYAGIKMLQANGLVTEERAAALEAGELDGVQGRALRSSKTQ